ncbi:lipid droplet-associated hydrolase [Anabrus simplex]|uniref:lipid droplet-associated hydrolase n=1 Tax=Anabrus simplex TaxID=316456 RepID=UPI0035A3AFB5
MMQKGLVTINGVPTYVATWGGWIEDNLQNYSDLVLCISGNPGVTGFYYEFLETVNSDLNIPVWIVSHAGHEVSRTVTVPKLQCNQYLYDLRGQINHKVEFIKKYVPRHVNLHLVGHSIGCKIILELLKDPSINSQVKKCYMLFPTVERMAVSPNGKFFTGIIKYIIPVILLLSWIFTLFPSSVKKILLNSYFFIHGTKGNVTRAAIKLINPTALRNVFFLALDEMDHVKELDHKFFFYYGTTDGWVPVKYYEDLKKDHPDVEAITCPYGYKHAFVLNSAKDVGSLVSKWIKSSK